MHRCLMILAVVFTGCIDHSELARRNHIAYMEMEAEKLGGEIRGLSRTADHWGEIDFTGSTATDAELAAFPWPEGCEQVVLEGTAAGDLTLARVAQLKGLEGLWLDNTNVTDLSVVQLSQATDLEYLSLVNTAITDRSIPAISKLTKLRSLSLDQTQIVGHNIHLLDRLRGLHQVDIRYCPNLDHHHIFNLETSIRLILHWDYSFERPPHVDLDACPWQ